MSERHLEVTGGGLDGGSAGLRLDTRRRPADLVVSLTSTGRSVRLFTGLTESPYELDRRDEGDRHG